MTNEEALEYLKSAREACNPWAIAAEVYNIAIEAVEKEIPQKPIFVSDSYGSRVQCPTCNASIRNITCTRFRDEPHRCHRCGQVFDWSEEKTDD